MRTALAITKKEIRTYIDSPVAYVFVIIFLGLCGFLYLNQFFLIGQADMRGYFGLLPFIFIFFMPAMTMRLWSEEKKLGTFQLLLTLPVRSHEAVIGKFTASMALLTVALILSLPIPIWISLFLVPAEGPGLDWGAVIGSYIGTIFLGAAYLSLGLFFSALTENQIVAFILATFFAALAILIGEPFVISSLDWLIPKGLEPVLEYVGVRAHYESMGRGVIDSRDVIYYLSFSFLFLFLTSLVVEHRRR